MQREDIELKDWGILILLSVIWGSSFILMKKALVSFQPIHLAAMRLSLAAIALSPFLIARRADFLKTNIWLLFLVGLVGNGIPAILFFLAQTQISSSLSGVLNSLTPIWTLLIGVLFFTTPYNRSMIWGVFIGFIGASSLIMVGNQSGIQGSIWYAMLIVLATFFYGLSGNIVKKYFQDTPSIVISAGSFLGVGTVSLIYLLFTDFSYVSWQDTGTWYSLGALLVLTLVGTVMATVVFYKLIIETNAVFGSSVAYLMPIVALFWGVIDGESIKLFHLIGLGLILMGVYLIRRKS